MNPVAAALAAALAGASPFQAEQPSVRRGNERLRAGDPAAALERYRQAEREAGAHPEIDFDRGDALWAQGHGEEARQAWRKAEAAARSGDLASRALQNTGNALDAAGDRAGAEGAFAEALRRDPGNEDARYNLEVMLRRKGARPPQGAPQDRRKDPQAGQQKDQERNRQEGQKLDQQGEPEDRGQAAERQRQAQQQDRRQEGREGQQDQASPPPGSPRREDQEGPGASQQAHEREEADGRAAAGARRTGAIDRQDAERLLDALRSRERNAPLQPTTRKDARRRDVEKDW